MAVNTLMNRRNLGSAMTSRGLSPNLWHKLNIAAIQNDPGEGVYEFQDFLSGGLITAPTTHAALVGLPLSGFSSSASQVSYGTADYASAVTGTPNNAAGEIILAETTTRESTSLRSDVCPYRVSKDFGVMCFEARIKISTVATNEISFFVGLFEVETLTVDIPVIAAGADTHLIASKNLIGFKKPIADTTTFDTIYRADSQTAVVVGDGMGTLAADTYVKVGFRYDPADNKLRYFIDNIEQVDVVSNIPDNTGTSFPADVNLGWILGMSVGTAASDNTLTCDWVACGQQFRV